MRYSKEKKKKNKINQICIIRGIRRLWEISPAIQIKESKKVYSRKQLKQQDFREIGENK